MTSTIPLPKLPSSPGVYLMRDVAGKIIYIGKAKNLKKRVASYFSTAPSREDQRSGKIIALVEAIRHVDYVPTASEREALVVERRLINRYQPDFNTMWKDDKSYPSVALTLGEDYPRLFLTRQRKWGRKTRYFGPYPSVVRVRQLLHWAWRKKLFPLRPCRLELSEKHPLPYEKVRWCLYLHTGECTAPCMGKISKKNYSKIVKRAEWFFGGNKEKLIAQWEREMKRHSRKMEFEKAADVRDRLDAIRHIQERITFREMTESALTARVRESRSIQDLMQNLGLNKPPQIMECFDISHIQGVEKVASMVRFENGRPDKSQYRKFIIKTVAGSDDFKAMAEVVGRRARRLVSEKKRLPDLLVIDGGKGQLSAALRALKKEKFPAVPIIALAKKEEEIFRPGQSQSLRLPNDSPGLLLLRQIRDEAHRFAITFHRQRRGKKAFFGD